VKLIACDPGLDGAFAFDDLDTGQFEVFGMPLLAKPRAGKTPKRAIDEQTLGALFAGWRDLGARVLVLEAVGGRPGQGAPAAFEFGAGYGFIRGCAVAHGFSIEPADPAKWKADMKVPGKKTSADAKAVVARANTLLPEHAHLWTTPTKDGWAEAAMLALWAERKLKLTRIGR
jgi:hypothetical protein